MEFSTKKKNQDKKRPSWRDALEGNDDAAGKKAKGEDHTLAKFKEVRIISPDGVVPEHRRRNPYEMQELAERELIFAENEKKFKRIEGAMARVEGRLGRPGTTVWADVEIEGRSTGDLPSEPTTYAPAHLGHAKAAT